jgi:hypothetical protein
MYGLVLFLIYFLLRMINFNFNSNFLATVWTRRRMLIIIPVLRAARGTYRIHILGISSSVVTVFRAIWRLYKIIILASLYKNNLIFPRA